MVRKPAEITQRQGSSYQQLAIMVLMSRARQKEQLDVAQFDFYQHPWREVSAESC